MAFYPDGQTPAPPVTASALSPDALVRISRQGDGSRPSPLSALTGQLMARPRVMPALAQNMPKGFVILALTDRGAVGAGGSPSVRVLRPAGQFVPSGQRYSAPGFP